MPGTDVSSAIETDKENGVESIDEMDNDETNKLLDSTFDINPAAKLIFNSPLTPNTRSPLKPIFKTPVLGSGHTSGDMFDAESDVDATPTNKNTGHSLFPPSPQF